MMTNREILEQAHAMIQQQKFREARQLLQPIADHPGVPKPQAIFSPIFLIL